MRIQAKFSGYHKIFNHFYTKSDHRIVNRYRTDCLTWIRYFQMSLSEKEFSGKWTVVVYQQTSVRLPD
jgi:hypothetical protein